MSLARSTFYAKNKVDLQRLKDEADLRDRIERIVLAYPGYGYRRLGFPHGHSWRWELPATTGWKDCDPAQ